MTNGLDPKFDWVSARDKCSAFQMFVLLQELAKANTDQRNTALGKERFTFTTHEDKDVNYFAVFDRVGDGRRTTKFRLIDGEVIEIEPHATEKFVAAITLTDEGECKFTIGNDPREPWQVLRRALESLFFGPHM